MICIITQNFKQVDFFPPVISLSLSLSPHPLSTLMHVFDNRFTFLLCLHFLYIIPEGGLFRKHGRRGAPHQRFVWVSSNLDYVHWRPLNKRHHSTKMSMPVADISGVVSGHKTPVFQRLGTPGMQYILRLSF